MQTFTDHAFPISRERPAWARSVRLLVECCAVVFAVAVITLIFVAGGM
jgi:hypothetical protein